jgi:ABC-type nitrate/sulfonate/bicarbonate transport system ATPase subunit
MSERRSVARISIASVTKRFESGDSTVTALDDVNLAVQDREIVTLVGASGCGKSTLLNLIAGFETPSGGRVLVDGQPIKGPGPDRGVIFQQTALFPWLSVEDNIAFGLSLRANQGKGDLQQVVERMLQKTGLSAFRERRPAELSGGMRQRAAIASVLAINPSTLLMDEPFGALDSLTRSIMQDFLLEIWEEQRKTVVLVTHDIDEAIYLADRTVVMTAHPGRICEVIDVSLPRPRQYEMRSEAAFIALRDHVTQIVRTEALKGTALPIH